MKATVLACVGVILVAGIASGVGARDVVHHDGNIELFGTETLLIENADYYQAGGIYLHDSARLVIRNANVILTESTDPDIWGGTSPIDAGGASTLEVQDSTIAVSGADASGRKVAVSATDSARVTILRSTIGSSDFFGILYGSGSAQCVVSYSTISEIGLSGQAGVTMVGCAVRWAVGIEFAGDSQVEIENLRGGYVSQWSTAAISEAHSPSPSATIKDSTIGAWSISISDQASVLLRDSDVDRISLNLNDPTGGVEGILPGTYQDWRLYGAGTASPSINLHLVRTHVGSWIVGLLGGQRDVTIANSRLSMLVLADYSGSGAIRETDVEAIWIARGTPSLSLTGTLITRGLQLADTTLTLRGDVRFAETAFLAAWEDSAVVRTHEIVVQDMAGEPVRNAAVSLYDAAGRKLGTQTTDSSGLCLATVTYSSGDGEVCRGVGVAAGAAIGTGQVCIMSAAPTVVIRVQ